MIAAVIAATAERAYVLEHPRGRPRRAAFSVWIGQFTLFDVWFFDTAVQNGAIFVAVFRYDKLMDL